MSKKWLENFVNVFKIDKNSSDTPTDDQLDLHLNLIATEMRSRGLSLGNFSDGYHTFNELYHHRAVLFGVICTYMNDKSWKSKLHDDGSMYDGMFIVGIETPEGQATYHYDIDPYWDTIFADVREVPNAPKWDGHTPTDAIIRISHLI